MSAARTATRARKDRFPTGAYVATVTRRSERFRAVLVHATSLEAAREYARYTWWDADTVEVAPA